MMPLTAIKLYSLNCQLKKQIKTVIATSVF